MLKYFNMSSSTGDSFSRRIENPKVASCWDIYRSRPDEFGAVPLVIPGMLQRTFGQITISGALFINFLDNNDEAINISLDSVSPEGITSADFLKTTVDLARSLILPEIKLDLLQLVEIGMRRNLPILGGALWTVASERNVEAITLVVPSYLREEGSDVMQGLIEQRRDLLEGETIEEMSTRTVATLLDVFAQHQ